MPYQDADISWDMLRRIVHDWLGTAVELDEVKPLLGGCINTTMALAVRGGPKAVLKISPHRVDRAYLQEAYQLNLMREIGLPSPQVYSCSVGTLDEPFSYLLMEFVEGINLAEAREQCTAEQFDHLQSHLADVMLTMHSRTSPRYARVTEKPQDEFESWPAFYRYVYDRIWHEAETSPLLIPKVRKQLAKIHEKLDKLIVHEDSPRLVHSDVWASNILAKADEHGRWWVTALLDPNCKYSHAEAEIAYMELFHTVNGAFMRTYQATHKLGDGYQRVRKPVYQLYPLINHVRLFGQEYVKPLMGMADRVSGLV